MNFPSRKGFSSKENIWRVSLCENYPLEADSPRKQSRRDSAGCDNIYASVCSRNFKNMNSKESQRIVREVLASDAVERVREASLEQGLACLRRRRHMRQTVQVCAIACLLLATGSIFVSLWMRHQDSERISSFSGHRSTLQASKGPEIQRITDAELLALFPGQTVALVGAPGDQRFLVLDSQPGRKPRATENYH
jgi:hypothetical protein